MALELPTLTANDYDDIELIAFDEEILRGLLEDDLPTTDQKIAQHQEDEVDPLAPPASTYSETALAAQPTDYFFEQIEQHDFSELDWLTMMEMISCPTITCNNVQLWTYDNTGINNSTEYIDFYESIPLEEITYEDLWQH